MYSLARGLRLALLSAIATLLLWSLLIRDTLFTVTDACARSESRAVQSSLLSLHLLALLPCLPRFPRAVSALPGGTALSSAAYTQASWLGMKTVSLAIIGQSLLLRGFGPCVDD